MDLATSTFFLGDRSSAFLLGDRRSLDFALLCKFLLLHDACGDGRGCEDSVVEYCEDSFVDVDGDCNIEASISSLLLLRYAALAGLSLNGAHYLHGKTLNFYVKIVPISDDIFIFLTVTLSSFSCR